MWAAIGLMIIMLGAFFTHLKFKEYQNATFVTVVFLLLLATAVYAV